MTNLTCFIILDFAYFLLTLKQHIFGVNDLSVHLFAQCLLWRLLLIIKVETGLLFVQTSILGVIYVQKLVSFISYTIRSYSFLVCMAATKQ